MPLSAENRDDFAVHGLENIPQQSVFTLAVNHTMRRWTPRLLSAVQHASMEKRPELARQWIVIVGYRETKTTGRNRLARWVILKIRRVHTWIYRRWSYNALRLPMDNQRAGMQALRQWKIRAQQQPTIVFPEGRGSKTFEQVRPGAGRFLAGLNVPVLPVSIWWEAAEARWQVVFGPPIAWSADGHLHDLQIGLEIAYGLPPVEAPAWQKALKDWDEAFREGQDTLPGQEGATVPNLNPTLS